MEQYNIKAFENQANCTDAYIYFNDEYPIGNRQAAALVESQEIY